MKFVQRPRERNLRDSEVFRGCVSPKKEDQAGLIYVREGGGANET